MPFVVYMAGIRCFRLRRRCFRLKTTNRLPPNGMVLIPCDHLFRQKCTYTRPPSIYQRKAFPPK